MYNMANEITIVELRGYNRDGDATSYLIASSATAAKGTLMMMLDDRTCSSANLANFAIAGILAEQKIADNSTRVTLLQNGDFRGTASGSITAGRNVVSASDVNYPNMLCMDTGVASSGAAIVGIATESVTNGNTFGFTRKGVGG